MFFEGGGGTPRPVRTFKLVIVICTTENCDDMPTSYILVLAVILMQKQQLMLQFYLYNTETVLL